MIKFIEEGIIKNYSCNMIIPVILDEEELNQIKGGGDSICIVDKPCYDPALSEGGSCGIFACGHNYVCPARK